MSRRPTKWRRHCRICDITVKVGPLCRHCFKAALLGAATTIGGAAGAWLVAWLA